MLRVYALLGRREAAVRFWKTEYPRLGFVPNATSFYNYAVLFCNTGEVQVTPSLYGLGCMCIPELYIFFLSCYFRRVLWSYVHQELWSYMRIDTCMKSRRRLFFASMGRIFFST